MTVTEYLVAYQDDGDNTDAETWTPADDHEMTYVTREGIYGDANVNFGEVTDDDQWVKCSDPTIYESLCGDNHGLIFEARVPSKLEAHQAWQQAEVDAGKAEADREAARNLPPNERKAATSKYRKAKAFAHECLETLTAVTAAESSEGTLNRHVAASGHVFYTFIHADGGE